MTTVTVTDKQISFEGHAGNRDVCICLSALSQGVGAIIGSGPDREPGLYRVWYSEDESHYVTIPEVVTILVSIISQLAQQYPENVMLVDAR